MSDSDLSDCSYHTALDTFGEDEFDLPGTLIEDGNELIKDQKELNVEHFEEIEIASGRHPKKAKRTPNIFKIGGVTKAKKNAFSLSGYQYKRFSDEIKKQYLLRIQSQSLKLLDVRNLITIRKKDASLKDAGEIYDIPEEQFDFSEEEVINVQSDPWKSEAVPCTPKYTDHFLSFEDSFVYLYSRPSSAVEVEKSEVKTAVTVQPTSLSTSIEQFEEEANLLEDVVEPLSLCSWFRAKLDTVRKTCCSICVWAE